MDEHLILRNRLKTVRKEKKLSQTELAELVGVSRNTVSSIETGQFNPTAKLALVLCIALDKKPPCYTAHEHTSRKHRDFVMSGNVIEIPRSKKLVPIWIHQLKVAAYCWVNISHEEQ